MKQHMMLPAGRVICRLRQSREPSSQSHIHKQKYISGIPKMGLYFCHAAIRLLMLVAQHMHTQFPAQDFSLITCRRANSCCPSGMMCGAGMLMY